MNEPKDLISSLFGPKGRNQLMGMIFAFACTLGVLFAMASCTENQRAKHLGGTMNIELPANSKLVTVTWKADEVWYLTRPMRDNERAETYNFQEESSWGVVEGTIVLKENRVRNGF